MNVFNMINGGGSGSGLYAWKKYERSYEQNTITYSDTSRRDDNTVYQNASAIGIRYYYSDSYTFDEKTGNYTLINPSYGSFSPISNLELEKGYYYATQVTGPKIFDGVNTQLYIKKVLSSSIYYYYIAPGGSYISYNIYTSTATETLIEYVISDDSTKYPNGGEQDGFYYERYADLNEDMFGCTKSVSGSFILSSSATSYTVTHNFGSYARLAIVWAETNPSDSSCVTTIGHAYATDGSSGIGLTYNARVTAKNNVLYASDTTSKCTLGYSSYPFSPNVKYNYIVLG